MLFVRLLKKVIQEGALRLIDANGQIHLIGDSSDPICTARLHKKYLNYTLCIIPSLSIPEAYMNGTLTIENGTIYDFIDLASSNYSTIENYTLYKILRSFDPAKLGQFNSRKKAKKNVSHHYDLSNELYSLFLDTDKQYSCAYFSKENKTLEMAQKDKKKLIASKLLLKPGLKVLDIGSGWGGLAMYLAEKEKIDVTGITLSEEQCKVSKKRLKQIKRKDHVQFRIQDYREETDVYDRIVSVGMFEHVGKRNYNQFFQKMGQLLAKDGIMLLHTIGRLNSPSPINPFIRKYIFPGADLPSLSEIMRAIEPLGLFVTDVEVLRLHYAETLSKWRARFAKRRDDALRIYDERFCRMWELYLSLCETGFRYHQLVVFQIQISNRFDALPWTRDYLFQMEKKESVEQKVKGTHAP